MKITIDTTKKTIVIHDKVNLEELLEFLTGSNPITIDEYSIEPQESKINNTRIIDKNDQQSISDLLEKIKRDQEKKSPYTKDWDAPFEIPCDKSTMCKGIKWEPQIISQWSPQGNVEYKTTSSTITDDSSEPDTAYFFYLTK